MADVLRDNDTLKELYLYSNKLGPEDASHIASMLANKRRLTALGLSNNFIGTEGALYLAEHALRDKPLLAKLSLEGNAIGSRGLRAIAEALSVGNEELREVYLYNNQIEDDGLEEFGAMLSTKKGLYALGLEFNKIGSEGIAHVLLAVRELKAFEKLYINANEIRGTA